MSPVPKRLFSKLLPTHDEKCLMATQPCACNWKKEKNVSTMEQKNSFFSIILWDIKMVLKKANSVREGAGPKIIKKTNLTQH